MGFEARFVSLVLLIGCVCTGCESQVPEHDVIVTSDCRGETETARFHFDDLDFETSCSGGFLTGWCYTNSGKGRLVSGDIGAPELILDGWEEFGPSSYEATIVSEEQSPDGDPEDRTIRCSWAVDANLAQTFPDQQHCYPDCSAEIEVVR